jgi:hypothetical protein
MASSESGVHFPEFPELALTGQARAALRSETVTTADYSGKELGVTRQPFAAEPAPPLDSELGASLLDSRPTAVRAVEQRAASHQTSPRR